MIRIENVSMSYQNEEVLKGLNLDIRQGEFVFLQGASGSGKNKLLKLLYREIEQFQGKIWIQDKPMIDMPKYATRCMVGTIFQFFELLEGKTVMENVSLAGEVMVEYLS